MRNTTPDKPPFILWHYHRRTSQCGEDAQIKDLGQFCSDIPVHPKTNKMSIPRVTRGGGITHYWWECSSDRDRLENERYSGHEFGNRNWNCLMGSGILEVCIRESLTALFYTPDCPGQHFTEGFSPLWSPQHNPIERVIVSDSGIDRGEYDCTN